MISFEVTDREGLARCGLLSTTHGVVETPVFMPVGTAGSVKGVTPIQLAATGSRMILANTYHLHLRPGADIVRGLGGLHRFMGFNGPILTDSGGYQVFSLADIRRVTEDGVEFRSHVDGATMWLDPPTAIQIQNQLGADIIMALDECPPLPGTPDVVAQAVDRTIRWAAQCKQAHDNPQQTLFGIVQGGLDVDLRRRCAEALGDIDFDGYAVGGLSVGETHDQMAGILPEITKHLPSDRPRYLMGVGMPRDILAAVCAGIDMFDCVLPTRNGRNSFAFTAGGHLHLRNSKHRTDDSPLEAGCDCEACAGFSRGYIRHLFNTNEMLGPTLTSIHNLRFYQRFMARVRDLIRKGELATIVREFPIAGESDRSEVEEKC
ncbi:MAG: tRNA guanosine(34) transglycosylase Tgt [Planctomycetota bacterium]